MVRRFRNVVVNYEMIMIMYSVLVTCSMVWNSNQYVFITVLMVWKCRKLLRKLSAQLQLKQLGLEIVLQNGVKVNVSVYSVEKYLWVVTSIVLGAMILFLVSLRILGIL